jgi:hypothetical protein
MTKRLNAATVLMILLVAGSCSKAPTVPVLITEDVARHIVSLYAVGDHAYDIEIPPKKQVVKNGVLYYFVRVSGLDDKKTLDFYVNSNTGDILGKDFQFQQSMSQISAKLIGAIENSRSSKLTSFVMGMWKTVDLYASEEDRDKAYGTPLERWSLLEVSEKEYPMDDVPCLGSPAKRAKRLKVRLEDGKEAWVDAPQVWISAALAGDEDSLGLSDAAGKHVDPQRLLLDFVVEPVSYESPRNDSSDIVLASPVLVDADGRARCLSVYDDVLPDASGYDADGIGAFRRTRMDTLAIALLPGDRKLSLVSSDTDEEGRFNLVWGIRAKDSEIGTRKFVTLIRYDGGMDEEARYVVVRVAAIEVNVGSGNLEGSWTKGFDASSEEYRFEDDRVSYYSGGRLQDSGSWQRDGDTIKMGFVSGDRSYSFYLSDGLLTLVDGKGGSLALARANAR